MENYPFKVRCNLAEYRKAADETQTALGIAVGVSKNAISSIENGVLPRLNLAFRIAWHYAVDITDIWTEYDSRHSGGDDTAR